MRKAIGVGAFPASWSLSHCASLAREAGFDGIELGYTLDGLLTPETTSIEAAQIRDTIHSADLELVSLTSGVLLQYNLLSVDAAERATARQHVRTMLRLASGLGTDTILLIPGFVGPIVEAGPPAVPDYEAAFLTGQEELRGLVEDAQRCGVWIAVENVWNKFLTGPLEMRQFIDGIGSPHVGVYFDAGNVLRTGYPEHWIRVLGKRIRRVHIKDFRVSAGNLHGFVNLLEGDLDFAAAIAALRAVGYDGWVTAELPARRAYPEGLIYETARTMEFILGGPSEEGARA